MSARLPVVPVVVALALCATATVAHATTFHVVAGGSGADCTQAAPCATVEDALTAHRVAPAADDVIDVGPGIFEGFAADDTADGGLTIQGTLSGSTHQTTLRALGDGIFHEGLTAIIGVCGSVGATLRDVDVDTQGADLGVSAIGVDGDSRLINVHAENQAGSTAGSVVNSCKGSPHIDRSVVVAGDGDTGVMVHQRLAVRNSTITSTDSPAILQNAPGLRSSLRLVVLRSTISSGASSTATILTTGPTTVDSSLVTGGGVAMVMFVGGTTWTIRNSTLDAGEPGYDPGTPAIGFFLVGSPANVAIESSILVDGMQVFQGMGTITCRYSDVPTLDPVVDWTTDCDTGAGTTNTSSSAAGLFVGGAPYSWQLAPGSPAIDAGRPGTLPATFSAFDLNGTKRIQTGASATCPYGPRVDMGAYEAPAVGCIPTRTTLPTVIAPVAPQVGNHWAAGHGTWTPKPASYTYAWVRCDADGASGCVDIGGATRPAYRAVAADVGHTLRVRVVAHTPAGDSAPATSDASVAVVARR